MEHKNIKGMVLTETKYKESDKILTVVTDSLGKISVYAKGVKNLTSKLGGLSFFCLLDLDLREGQNDMFIATRAEKVMDFFSITKDLEAQSYANYILHLANDLFLEDEPFPPLFQLLVNTIYLYAQNKKEKELLKCIFELKALSMSGYSLSVEECCSCEKDCISYLNIYDGDGYCLDCGNQNIGKPVSSDVLKAIRHITYTDDKSLFSFQLSSPLIRELSMITTNYVKICLEKEYSALAYLRKIQKGLKSC